MKIGLKWAKIRHFWVKIRLFTGFYRLLAAFLKKNVILTAGVNHLLFGNFLPEKDSRTRQF